MSESGLMIGLLLLVGSILYQLHIISRQLETIIDNQQGEDDE